MLRSVANIVIPWRIHLTLCGGDAVAELARMEDAEPGGTDEELDPRLHYANERTFLAWIRTALALVTAGLVVTQLLPAFRITGGRRLVGLPLIVLGTYLAIACFFQWDRNETAMRQRRPLPRSHLPVVVAGGVAVVAIIAVLVGAFASVGR
jgi:putative membrane protein